MSHYLTVDDLTEYERARAVVLYSVATDRGAAAASVRGARVISIVVRVSSFNRSRNESNIDRSTH